MHVVFIYLLWNKINIIKFWIRLADQQNTFRWPSGLVHPVYMYKFVDRTVFHIRIVCFPMLSCITWVAWRSTFLIDYTYYSLLQMICMNIHISEIKWIRSAWLGSNLFRIPNTITNSYENAFLNGNLLFTTQTIAFNLTWIGNISHLLLFLLLDLNTIQF